MRHPLMDHIIQEHGPIMGNRVNQRRLPITVKVFLGRRIHDQSERAVCRPAAAIRISTAAPVPAATALCSPAGRTPAYAARTAEIRAARSRHVQHLRHLADERSGRQPEPARVQTRRQTHNAILPDVLPGGRVTLGIGWLVWYHRVSGRIGEEQAARGLPVTVTASTFWLWGILGSLIAVGPFIYIYKLLHAMNDLSADYNVRGF